MSNGLIIEFETIGDFVSCRLSEHPAHERRDLKSAAKGRTRATIAIRQRLRPQNLPDLNQMLIPAALQTFGIIQHSIEFLIQGAKEISRGMRPRMNFTRGLKLLFQLGVPFEFKRIDDA